MQIFTVLAPINNENLLWAKQHYPEYYKLFKAESRTATYHLGRALLHFLLTHFYNESVFPTFIENEHGKPSFIELPYINFNISHSKKTLAIIIGEAPYLGIDIEQIKIRKNFPDLEKRVFKGSEITWIHAQKDPIQAFFLLWSAKEAYLKAEGVGLSGLSSLTLDPINNKINGTLSKGVLSLAIKHDESFALYTPQNSFVQHYQFNAGLLETQAIDWALILND